MEANNKYRTRPISGDVWNLMKELRRERAKLSYRAPSEGGICVTGFAWDFLSLLAGFGNFGNPSPGANFTKLAREGVGDQGLSKYVEISENKGLTPVCGAIGAHLGQVYAGASTQGTIGDEIRPDFVYQPAGCHGLIKGAQVCADILGIPMLHIDLPKTATENSRKYLFSQLANAIEWIGQRTGKTFDDEKFIEATRNEIYSRVMWARICELMKHIPAPITYREAMSLRLPLVTYAYSKRVREYIDALYNEIQQRIKDGIAGTAFEKKRLMHDGLHPLYRPDILRWPEEYGASFVWGQFFMAFGAWKNTEDGHRISANTLEERGIELHGREDALRELVDISLPGDGGNLDPETYEPAQYIRMIDDWHIDGVVLHMARRCAVLTGGVLRKRADLREKGIPVGYYEASEADPQEFDEKRIRKNFDMFMEILGLEKI